MPILGASASGAKSSPVAPTIGTATNVGTSRAYNNGSASVTFTAPNSKLPITSYTVTSSPGGFTASGASSPLTVTGLQSATAYTFTVTATSAAGTSAASSASNSITATTVPQAPTIGTATASGSSSATVTYTAGATGGAAVSTFTATSSPGSLTGTGASSPITVSGLTAGTAYTFTVTATNANGTSAASSVSNSITPQLARFVAAGSGTSIFYSDNGTSWTNSGTTAPAAMGQAVHYGGNKFVMAGSSQYAYSSDGVNWTKISSPLNNITSMVYTGTAFIGVKYDGASAYVTRSTDGITWTNYQLSASSFSLFKVVYANGVVQALTNNGDTCFQSTNDGISWSSIQIGASFGYRKNAITLPLSNGYTWGSTGGNQMYYTTDLTTWTQRSVYSGSGSYTVTSLNGGPTNYMGTIYYDDGDTTTVRAIKSTSGINGTYSTVAATGYWDNNQPYKLVTYNGTTWVWVRGDSNIRYTSDQATFTTINLGSSVSGIAYSTNNG